MDQNDKSMEPPRKIVEPPITVPKPRPQTHHHQQQRNQQHHHQQHRNQQYHHQQQQRNQQQTMPVKNVPTASKYTELLHAIEDLGQYIRPTYAGHRGSTEKIKQGITKARLLVKECLVETERSSRQ